MRVLTSDLHGYSRSLNVATRQTVYHFRCNFVSVFIVSKLKPLVSGNKRGYMTLTIHVLGNLSLIYRNFHVSCILHRRF